MLLNKLFDKILNLFFHKKDIDITNNINWNIYTHNERRIFTIPVDGVSQEEAREQIRSLMNKYKEEIIWTDENIQIPNNNISYPKK